MAKIKHCWGFPDGPAVKYLPANAGDTCSWSGQSPDATEKQPMRHY